MSIRTRIAARLHAIGDGFDRYFAPWAADVQRANAHRAEAERIQAEQDETYAQAMARLTGADPAAFEPEPGDWTPPADPRLDSFGPDYDQDYALARAAEWEQLAVYGTTRTPADPDAETSITTEDPWAEAGGQDAGDSDPDWVDPEADLMYGDTFYWTQPTSAGHAATREQQGDWATLPDDLQAQYLGDRAAEMTADDPAAFGNAVARMANDGVPGEQQGQVLDTARAWRDNEATAERAEPEVRHTAEEREAAEWRERNAEADPYANRDLRGELAEEAAEAARGLLALHDGHLAAWHKVGDLRREPVNSPAYQAAITDAKAKDAEYRDALDATQAAGVRLPGEDPEQFAERVTGSTGQHAAEAEDQATGEPAEVDQGFMGAPVPEADAIEVTRPDGDRFVTRHADLDRARLLYREADGWSCKPVTGQHDAQIEAGQ